MKESGFTLTELIAVITVLSILTIITTPRIINLINESKVNLNDRQRESIETAARNWGTANIILKDNKPSISEITLDKLKNSGYLDEDIKNIINKEEAKGKVCVYWENNQFIYQYIETGECLNEE